MPLLLAVMGPTASGKTNLAERLADALGAQLVNADAFQIYRGMDVGTAKPANKDRYALLDLRDPDCSFGVGEWVGLAVAELGRLWEAGQNAVVVGGTGLYVRALFEEYADMRAQPPAELRAELMAQLQTSGLGALVERLRTEDPVAAARVDPRNPARVRRALERALTPRENLAVRLPPFQKLKLGLDPPGPEHLAQIDRRLPIMVQNGWVQEVRDLRQKAYSRKAPGFRAIGYQHIWAFLEGEIDWDCAVRSIADATRRYAKRQRTWMRSEPGLVRLTGFGWADATFAEAMERVALLRK